MSTRQSVIVAGARTAFGKFGGQFKAVPAVQLGASVIEGALQRSGINADQVEGVIMGMVLQAGAGQIPSRQAARLAGLSWDVPSETINKVCASGLRAITAADQMIRSGDAHILVAGGMESMSRAPYAVPSARWGARMGNAAIVDLMNNDGLFCAFHQVPMGSLGNRVADEFKIGRKEQDEWALRSHIRAVAAQQNGRFAEEIVTITLDDGTKAGSDECPRPDTDAAKLAKLKPAFDKTGTITAGNAPGVNDGAAAVTVMSAEEASRQGIMPLATILGHASAGAEAAYLATVPALAIRRLLKKTGIPIERIDLFEVNEAFASVVLISGQMLGWDPEKVNVNGGAIALGHPIGASGARIVLTLIHELKRRGGGLGIAAICSGGAQGDAILLQVEG
ncbi:acetyl-CoA C-acetyltransferase [Paenibacillus glycanilyticus]|uniref:acetyl-CoA C-acetyltransferase n=1 Tax=Paenibacillus glycanilyticus TaxID=126569 RepID=UPI00204218AF|nr:acetyl-CoA C-acetyltransferase [Paenibacillus glycanilyticus]MCM3628616.1 acetyl-CoA C-acetyltransferase [Paenibacillus glycanilyticus]